MSKSLTYKRQLLVIYRTPRDKDLIYLWDGLQKIIKEIFLHFKIVKML